MGCLVYLDMVVWPPVLCSLNNSVVQMLTVDIFCLSVYIHHMCSKGQSVVAAVDMGFHTFVFAVAGWIPV